MRMDRPGVLATALLVAPLVLLTGCRHQNASRSIDPALREVQDELCQSDPEHCVKENVGETRRFFSRTLHLQVRPGEWVEASVFSWAALTGILVGAVFVPFVPLTGPAGCLIGSLFLVTGPLGALPIGIGALVGTLWPALAGSYVYEVVAARERKAALVELAHRRRERLGERAGGKNAERQAKLRALGERRWKVTAKGRLFRYHPPAAVKALEEAMEALAHAECSGDGAHLHYRVDGSWKLVPAEDSDVSETARCLGRTLDDVRPPHVWDLDVEVRSAAKAGAPRVKTTVEALPAELRPPSPAASLIPRAKRFKPTDPATDVELSVTCSHDLLRGASREQLRLIRNEVYARHGRTFSSEDLRAHFGAKPWYRPREDYSDRDLSARDRACVKRVKLWEDGAVILADDVDLDEDGQQELVALVLTRPPERFGALPKGDNAVLIVGDIEAPWPVPWFDTHRVEQEHAAHDRVMRTRPYAGPGLRKGRTPVMKGAGRMLLLDQAIGYTDEGAVLQLVDLRDGVLVVHRFSRVGADAKVTREGLLHWDTRTRGPTCHDGWVFEFSWGDDRLQVEHEDFTKGFGFCPD